MLAKPTMLVTLWTLLCLVSVARGQDAEFTHKFRSRRSPPNIVFIMVDDLGWNDVGYHGSEIRTPNLDELATNGVKLEQYYTAAVCGPTRAQFLSGKYSIHLGIPGNIIACRRSGLTTKVPTIADALKKQGYATHMIGKWHAGFHSNASLPTSRGFDTFRGHLLGHGDHYTHTRQYHGIQYLDFYDNDVPDNSSWGQYSTDIFTQRAVEIINANNNGDKPMFMFLSYQAPHNPLQVPDRYLTEYNNLPGGKRKSYAAMVTAIDEGVGEITQALKNNGMHQNTVLIFTSDNGGDVGSGGSNYPLRGNKGSLFQGGIRSLGFVSSPLIPFPRRSVTDLIHVTDWLPTLLHIAEGSSSSLNIDGINQWHTISTAFPSNRKEIIHNISRRRPTRRNRDNGFNTNIKASLTVWPWKILTGRQSRDIIYPNPAVNLSLWQTTLRNRPSTGRGIQLYNIDLDPSENQNVASQNSQVVQTLLNKLGDYERSIVPATDTRATRLCDPSLNGGVWGPYTSM